MKVDLPFQHNPFAFFLAISMAVLLDRIKIFLTERLDISLGVF